MAELIVGRIRGGLSAAAVFACAIFGSISGSAAATLTCIGSIMMPHLRKANYPEGTAAAVIVSACPLGLLIPPRRVALLFGARVTNTPVNKMLNPTLIMIFFAWLPTLMITTFVPVTALWLPELLFGR